MKLLDSFYNSESSPENAVSNRSQMIKMVGHFDESTKQKILELVQNVLFLFRTRSIIP